jgi:hypothetical protein|tara:strand:+ start:1521 stop:1811 length:291 start_codon:yes stop_codon:yes gene_type:complete
MITDYKSINDLFKATCNVVFGMKDKKPLELVIIKGEGWGHYMSHYEKILIPIKKGSSWYILDEEPNEKGEFKLFWPSKLFFGQVIWVSEDDFDIIQ